MLHSIIDILCSLESLSFVQLKSVMTFPHFEVVAMCSYRKKATFQFLCFVYKLIKNHWNEKVFVFCSELTLFSVIFWGKLLDSINKLTAADDFLYTGSNHSRLYTIKFFHIRIHLCVKCNIGLTLTYYVMWWKLLYMLYSLEKLVSHASVIWNYIHLHFNIFIISTKWYDKRRGITNQFTSLNSI